MISIVGIGSGNRVEELTIKAYNTLKNSDIGIYPGNFIGEELKELFEDKTMFTGRDITSEKIKNIFHNNRDKNICLMVSGDPALYSGQFNTNLCLDEHIKWFNEHNYNYEMIPGLSSLSILCAKKSIDLTPFSKTQNVFITSIERLRDLKCFNYTELKSILSTKPVLALYQSLKEFDNIKSLLMEFYPPTTKVIFAQSLSWSNECIFETDLKTLNETESTTSQFNDQTLILVYPSTILTIK
ncbi:SAM-dependent methyltransferase [Colwellia psychrerythraea]|uniref:Putative cobalamin biosynthesis protein n=1 Tax=Colwellia psychrerythraea (strain 34H / ATCC BAA-681) TaxID=167879 RepID=Q47ZZ3_COLP3|nr:SAM-dependent methyltransferase [Colwellia psychrerythraea]AAZ24254.1 putative cobalamin biosynthesis protein [Colwellia psychrerythraea 34H]